MASNWGEGLPDPVQLGVLYASKKPTGLGAVSPNYYYSVADTAFRVYTIYVEL